MPFPFIETNTWIVSILVSMPVRNVAVKSIRPITLDESFLKQQGYVSQKTTEETFVCPFCEYESEIHFSLVFQNQSAL